MNPEIKDGRISIDIGDIFDDLDIEGKRDLVERLACEGDIIHMVADQLVYGYTNDGSCGGSHCDASVTSTPLDKYTRLVAKMSGAVAKKEIGRLERQVKELKADNGRLSKYTWRLYHSYNLRYCPSDIIKGVNIGWRKGE